MNAARRTPRCRAKDKARRQYIRKHHFFQWRAQTLSAKKAKGVTAIGLARLWKAQRGRCALSGRKLGRDAHIDHIIPMAKGGATVLENLRFLDPDVNFARRAMLDEDFIRLCEDVLHQVWERLKDAGEI